MINLRKITIFVVAAEWYGGTNYQKQNYEVQTYITQIER